MVHAILAFAVALGATAGSRSSVSWVRQGEVVGVTAMAATADGGVVVTGTGIHAGAFGRGDPDEARLAADRLSHGAPAWSTWIARYRADGKLAFLRQTRGQASAKVTALAVGPEGRTFVAGSLTEWGDAVFGSGEPRAATFRIRRGEGAFLACYDGEGRLAWARLEEAERPSGIAVAAVFAQQDGGAVVLATIAGPVVFGAGTPHEARFTTDPIPNADRYPGFQPTIVAARYGARGDLLWARRLADRGRVAVAAAAELPRGGIALAVSYDGASAFGDVQLPAVPSQGVALVTLDADARARSAVPVLGSGASPAQLVASSDGGVALLGRFQGSLAVAGREPLRGDATSGPLSWGTSFLVRVDPGGRVAAASALGSVAIAGAVPSDGGLIAWGVYHEGTAVPVAGGRERRLVSEGIKDLFLAAYGRDGALRWIATAGSRRMQEAWAIAAMPDGGIALAGGTWGAITLGRGEAAPVRVDHARGWMFVARLAPGRRLEDAGRQEELARVATELARLRADGTAAYRARRYPQACDLFRRASEVAPWDGAVLADLALCLEKKGDAAAAVAGNWTAIATTDAEDPSTSESEQVRKAAFYNLWRLGVRVALPAPGKCAPLQAAPGCAGSFHACVTTGGMTARMGSSSWTWLHVGRTAQAVAGTVERPGGPELGPYVFDWLKGVQGDSYWDDGGDPLDVLIDSSEEPEDEGTRASCEVVAADACRNRIVFSCAWRNDDGSKGRALRERWVSVPREP